MDKTADTTADTATKTGTVIFFDDQKGFGFIALDTEEPDVFVSASTLRQSGLNTLESDQKVRFQVRQDTRGRKPKAINLELVGDPPEAEGSAD